MNGSMIICFGLDHQIKESMKCHYRGTEATLIPCPKVIVSLADGSTFVIADIVRTFSSTTNVQVVSTISDIGIDTTNIACFCHPQYVQILLQQAAYDSEANLFVLLYGDNNIIYCYNEATEHRVPDHVISDTIALSELN
jgi:hypothetical protein